MKVKCAACGSPVFTMDDRKAFEAMREVLYDMLNAQSQLFDHADRRTLLTKARAALVLANKVKL